MIVVDASVVAPALADDASDGDTARARFRGEDLAAPELLDIEVTSAIRKVLGRGLIDLRRATIAMENLRGMAIARAPHAPLLPRIWELQANLTPYDAAYVALAELLGVTLVTADGRLSRAPGIRCAVEKL